MHHFVDATFTKKNFFYFFSQKYPAFVEFYCDEIFGATCALCKEKLAKWTEKSSHAMFLIALVACIFQLAYECL